MRRSLWVVAVVAVRSVSAAASRAEVEARAAAVAATPLFVNPDKRAEWPKARNWRQKRPANASAAVVNAHCSGARESQDVIVYLGQKTHSSYDATHGNTLNASMSSVAKHMLRASESDVIVWHEGDIGPEDADALSGVTNVRFCRLAKETGWGPPDWLGEMPPSNFSPGYRYMIRFYAVTIWRTLYRLGYEWVMRFDDDSFLLSDVPYNVFADMRARNKLYGYRTLSRECPNIFGDFVEDFVEYARGPGAARLKGHGATGAAGRAAAAAAVGRRRLEAKPRRLKPGYEPWYCAGPGRLGFYNNWFVTKVRWWLDHERAARFIGAFDRSNLIFTRRCNDLIFTTAVVKLLMPRAARTRYVDFSYQHHTVQNGLVTFGGLETGVRDPAPAATAAAYAAAYRSGGPPLVARKCSVQADEGGAFRDALFVSPARDAASRPTKSRRRGEVPTGPLRFESPYCGPDGTAALE